MRMKKIILIAAVAIAAAACSKTFDTNLATEKAIGFGTWAENLTKAEARVQGTSTFLAGDTFAVSGYKETTSPAAKVTVFDNVAVTASGDPVDKWSYETLRFWDTNYDSYTFFAVSPSGAATIAPQAGTIAATDKTFSGKNNDILVAGKVVVEKGSKPYFNGYNTVNLLFHHASSLVDVKVKKSSALKDNEVKIKAFQFNNIATEGKIAVSSYTYDSVNDKYLPVFTWTPTNNDGTYTTTSGVNEVTLPVTVLEDNAFDSANTTPNTTPAGSAYVINNLVVMPQDITTQTITLTYTIQGDAVDHAVTLNFADFDIIDNDNQEDTKVGNWKDGKHYTFYITIDAHAIEFNASIDSWDAVYVNGYHYILN